MRDSISGHSQLKRKTGDVATDDLNANLLIHNWIAGWDDLVLAHCIPGVV